MASMDPDLVVAALCDQRFVHYPHPGSTVGGTYAECLLCSAVVEVGPRDVVPYGVRLVYAMRHRQVCPLT